jgi:hypothetical protein
VLELVKVSVARLPVLRMRVWERVLELVVVAVVYQPG